MGSSPGPGYSSGGLDRWEGVMILTGLTSKHKASQNPLLEYTAFLVSVVGPAVCWVPIVGIRTTSFLEVLGGGNTIGKQSKIKLDKKPLFHSLLWQLLGHFQIREWHLILCWLFMWRFGNSTVRVGLRPGMRFGLWVTLNTRFLPSTSQPSFPTTVVFSVFTWVSQHTSY